MGLDSDRFIEGGGSSRWVVVNTVVDGIIADYEMGSR